MRRIAIVTGGGSGLGYCLNDELLKHGMDVLIIGRQEEKLHEAQIKLSEKHGDKIRYIVGDISDEVFVRNLFSNLEKDNFYVQNY